MLIIALSIALATAPLPSEDDHALVVTGVGRFAILADLKSIQPDGDGVRMRSLQISEENMIIGGVAYSGGWSWWRFDCSGKTADRLDFASLRRDGTEGPLTPEDAPPYAISPGGDAEELAAIACDPQISRSPDVTTVRDAVTLGQALLRGELDSPR